MDSDSNSVAVTYPEFTLLTYPAATNFWKWSRIQFNKYGIGMTEIDTHSDYYQIIFKIKSGNVTVYTDWKHLSINEIQYISTILNCYGYTIDVQKSIQGYLVRMVPLTNYIH